MAPKRNQPRQRGQRIRRANPDLDSSQCGRQQRRDLPGHRQQFLGQRDQPGRNAYGDRSVHYSQPCHSGCASWSSRRIRRHHCGRPANPLSMEQEQRPAVGRDQCRPAADQRARNRRRLLRRRGEHRLRKHHQHGRNVDRERGHTRCFQPRRRVGDRTCSPAGWQGSGWHLGGGQTCAHSGAVQSGRHTGPGIQPWDSVGCGLLAGGAAGWQDSGRRVRRVAPKDTEHLALECRRLGGHGFHQQSQSQHQRHDQFPRPPAGRQDSRGRRFHHLKTNRLDKPRAFRQRRHARHKLYCGSQ